MFENWYAKIPKIELHMHLEGAIPLEALWHLIENYGGDDDVKSFSQLKEKFNYRDFSHFLNIWSWKNRYLRKYEDFTFIAEAVARDLRRQNVKYAEVFFSPSSFKRYLKVSEIAYAVRLGFSKVEGIKLSLIADLVRDFGPENEYQTLLELNEAKGEGVIGIGIGGSELRYPPELFLSVFEKARELGFRTCAHAGEAAGPSSVWGAVNALKVERIGHGTRAVEDSQILNYIRNKGITIDLCPISNLKTKVINKIQDHPIKKYLELGIPISINTDDPKMFGNSLSEEYMLLESELGIGRQTIIEIIINSINSSWQPENEKRKLISSFKEELKNMNYEIS